MRDTTDNRMFGLLALLGLASVRQLHVSIPRMAVRERSRRARNVDREMAVTAADRAAASARVGYDR